MDLFTDSADGAFSMKINDLKNRVGHVRSAPLDDVHKILNTVRKHF